LLLIDKRINHDQKIYRLSRHGPGLFETGGRKFDRYSPIYSLRFLEWFCREANLLKKLEAASGFEPENNGFADRCLTTWLCRLFEKK
jgi:hypothetical protein